MADNLLDYLPFKIFCINLLLFELICSFLSNRFSCSFRSFIAYHLMRFSLNSTRSESVVPKVYPDRVTTTSYSSKFVSHYHSSLADVEIYNSYKPLLFVLPSLHIGDCPDNSLYYIEDNNRTSN